MKLKILKSMFVIMAVLSATYVAGTAALFTDSAVIENNTFASGSVDLKLFYSCPGTVTTYDVGSVPVGTGNGAVVDCPFLANDGTGDENSLKYDSVDGATYDVPAAGNIYNQEAGSKWATTNGWWDGLSSAVDHTNVYPGWSNTTAPGASIDLLSVGNAGTLPVDLTATLAYGAADVNEGLEPFDGVIPGGDRVDPLTDANWVALLGKTYDTMLGDVINTTVERVDNTGAVLNSIGPAKLSTLVGPVTLGALKPNEVAYVRYNFSMDSDLTGPSGDVVDNLYQNKVFDYSMTFDAANQTP